MCLFGDIDRSDTFIFITTAAETKRRQNRHAYTVEILYFLKDTWKVRLWMCQTINHTPNIFCHWLTAGFWIWHVFWLCANVYETVSITWHISIHTATKILSVFCHTLLRTSSCCILNANRKHWESCASTSAIWRSQASYLEKKAATVCTSGFHTVLWFFVISLAPSYSCPYSAELLHKNREIMQM